VTAQQRQDEEPDTVDIEEDTEDVVPEEEESKDPTNPTEPGSNPKRAFRRVQMPTKVEIIKAVESVRTESLDVDEVTREAARTPKTEDLD
jgi:hypothetical protein